MVQPHFLGVAKSVSGRRWRGRLGDDRMGLAIAQRCGVPELVGRVLAARGVDSAGAEDFLSPSLRASLPDPSLLRDMERAAERIAKAITGGEDVAVFGDYDVDGATSAALLWRFFEAAGADLRIYIPDRLVEGYGPNEAALLRLLRDGVALVITVDCGTMAHAPLAAAARAGLEVIVVDHHLAGPELPEAVAVINPNRLDESREFGQLAAVGVAFLLVVAINRELRRLGWYDREGGRGEPDLLQWLDLVALGTVCDIVPLTGVNRALVAQGLKVMARRTNEGLAALADVARLIEAPGTYHAGFLLGPRVNAGGRVGEAGLGARLLTTHDTGEAARIARELDALNSARKEIEAGVEAAAVDLTLRALGDDGTPPAVLCVAAEGWHPGVIGIVASRLKDKFRRPALVIALADGVGKGSARSIPGVDLGSAVAAARQEGLLIDGGGHAMAAGLSVEEGRVGDLADYLRERLGAQVARAVEDASLGIDGALAARGATPELLDLLARAGPFGAGNPEPRFALADVECVKADIVGRDHVRCILAGGDGGRVHAIAFGAADSPLGQALLKRGGGKLHVAGHLRANNWQGRRRVQLTIDDVATAP